MTWIDWLIVALVIASIPQGLRRGAGTTAGSAVGVIFAYIAASYGYRTVTGWFGDFPVSRPDWYNLNPVPAPWQATIAFLVVFLVMSALFTILAGVALGSLTPSPASRLTGAAGGALRGVLVSAALLMIALASPAGNVIASDVVRSAIAEPIADGANATIAWINAAVPPPFQVFGGPGARF